MRVVKSKSFRSPGSSKLKKLNGNVELKKLMAEQTLLIAQHEAEMEKKKIIHHALSDAAGKIKWKCRILSSL